MPQILGFTEEPPPPPRRRKGSAVPVVLVLLALAAGLLATGVVPLPRDLLPTGLLPQDEADAPAATGALTVEVATPLAGGEGTCHAVCQLDYRRTGPADDELLERLRPRLQELAIALIRRMPRARLASAAGVAELERQLLRGCTEVLRDSGARLVGLRVVGMRFAD